MFQTELLHLLQSLESGFFTGVMKFISFLEALVLNLINIKIN